MENPMYWGPVERAIHDAYQEWDEGHQMGVCGLSLPMTIANKLRAEGLISDEQTVFTDYSTGSTHPDCDGDTDLCPDKGCKNCQGPDYDNLIRGRIVR